MVFRTLWVCEAGMVLSRVRLGSNCQVRLGEKSKQPGVSEFRALGGTNDPETIFPSVSFLERY